MRTLIVAFTAISFWPVQLNWKKKLNGLCFLHKSIFFATWELGLTKPIRKWSVITTFSDENRSCVFLLIVNHILICISEWENIIMYYNDVDIRKLLHTQYRTNIFSNINAVCIWTDSVSKDLLMKLHFIINSRYYTSLLTYICRLLKKKKKGKQ